MCYLIVMREYLVKTKKIGDALTIILPKELVQAEQIGGDMVLKITVQKFQRKVSSPEDDPWRLLE
ncbi:MAG: hypothetical protein NWE92_04410 [Candidatus Bathyarchaeota archaeon]|nr:hypothetical protein [Candidatus Bathyarchaeota archaeon]